jgi:putative endonuclease
MTFGNYFVYITTNPGKTVLYTGVTNDLKRRVHKHNKNMSTKKTFVGRYYCYNLIYYEHYPDINHAIQKKKK